jgi:hypothetical protein
VTSRMRALLAVTVTAAVSAAATGLLVSAAVPAHAASRVVRDPVGDVGVVSLVDGGVRIDAGLRNDDLTSVRTSYGHGRITITARLRAVRRNPQVLAEVRTPSRVPRYVVSGIFTHRHGRALLYGSARSGTALPCAGLRVRAERAKGRVVLSVPASCVGSPRWVRTSFATTALVLPSPAAQAWPGAFDDARQLVDVLGMDGITRRWYRSSTTRLPLGPKVHRD